MDDHRPLPYRLVSAARTADGDTRALLLEAAQRIARFTLAINAHQRAKTAGVPVGGLNHADAHLWALLDGDQ